MLPLAYWTLLTSFQFSQHFQRGTCIAGDHCAFAHVLVDEPQTSGSSAPSSPDLAPNEVERLAAPRGKSDIICRWFRSPHGCRNGESCAYSHRLPVKKPSKKNRKAPASNTVTGKTETQANRQAKEAMGSLVLHPVIKSSKFDADRLTAGASANGHDDDEDNIEVIHSDNSSVSAGRGSMPGPASIDEQAISNRCCCLR